MNLKFRVAALLLAGAIAAPVVMCLLIFGATISNDHTRWAEFGSAIGGIYAPLVALLALMVLIKQVALQTQMNTHEFDQAYLQQARADIEFYSKHMAQVMASNALPGRSLDAVLKENFLPTSATELDSQRLRELAANIHELIPPAFDIWAAVYPTLAGLEAGKTPMYNMTLGSSTQKLTALLSFETCVALDNFHRARSEGRLKKINYVFSPLLAKK
jgi:hypothetical protein